MSFSQYSFGDKSKTASKRSRHVCSLGSCPQDMCLEKQPAWLPWDRGAGGGGDGGGGYRKVDLIVTRSCATCWSKTLEVAATKLS
jgi:hypothetical protein